ncbi:MAG: dihydroorotate dehydrogenase B catalytic subunit [Acidobacteria bacterium RIFCSPHIGHO2_02_FULL_67_57]|nr:MAG: dihydroorotate dehydrogenase B catalytic subunit [Acidobacteria bacterium RIFCSPHIGHO2_02_FULL_67_57]
MGVDLSVELAGLRLKNPVLVASGTFGYGIEFAEQVDLNRLGGIVVKGLSAQPMEGAPAPRLCETPAGMLNAVGLQNIGVRAFIAEKLPALARFDTAIIANVFGHTVEEYVEVIEQLERAEGVAAYELNISCPNVKRGGVQFGTDPQLTREVVGAARRAARRRPLIVKLSPNVTDIAALARAAEEAGAQALSAVNTFTGMAIDLATRRSRLGQPTGGLSGPAIKPLALRMVYEAARAVRIPVIGLGGIATGKDAAEFLVAGAKAVQVGTANFVQPFAAVRIIEELETYCRSNKIAKVSELYGTLRTE